ncbi:MAG: hypothetical protein H6815_13825 [Phycisphaeraceae bacterium]|nr:hypothetical protein [Phycisphaerales bacterium]MCB9861519.1 hypothetical protein [Phycisphaeraceae bacterium]
MRPPVHVADPTTVYLVDYGDTSRLWLPKDDNNAFVEWGYGDWRWYAKDQQSYLYGSIVFFWPTPGTLARREHDFGPLGADGNMLWELDGYATTIHEIDVERSDASELLVELESRFDRQRDSEIYNLNRRMYFVKDASSYWLGHQSSSVMAGWLRKLGCRVSGFAVVADFRVRAPGRTAHLQTRKE